MGEAHRLQEICSWCLSAGEPLWSQWAALTALTKCRDTSSLMQEQCCLPEEYAIDIMLCNTRCFVQHLMDVDLPLRGKVNHGEYILWNSVDWHGWPCLASLIKVAFIPQSKKSKVTKKYLLQTYTFLFPLMQCMRVTQCI